MKSTMKRTRDGEQDDGSSRKQTKTENTPIVKPQTASELNAIMAQQQNEQNGPLQLMQFIDDCLEVVFQYLDVKDLNNVAEADTSFVPLVRSVFSQRYRHKQMVLNLGDIPVIVPRYCKEIPKDVPAASFYKNFGPEIVNLKIIGMNRQHLEIETSLMKHCTESIVELELVSCTSCFKSIKQPFEKVKHLVIDDSSLMSPLLNKWFPNVVSLRLKYKSSQPQFLAAHFPKMIWLTVEDPKMKIRQRTLEKMLRLHPQLKAFYMTRDYSFDFLRLVSECLPRLTELKLFVPKHRFQSFGDQKVHFANVRTFGLTSWCSHGEFVSSMPFSLPKLRHLYLHSLHSAKANFNSEVLNFIKQNKKIKELSLLTLMKNSIIYNDLISIIESLPNLKIMFMDACIFTSDELLQLLTDCFELQIKEMHFRFNQSGKRLEFQTNAETVVANKWTVIDSRRFTYHNFALQFNKI